MPKKKPEKKTRKRNISIIRILVWVVIIIAALYGLYQAISMAWICDDAFISFRYAKNFVNGNGLVFNTGERVEGYTNFLWTIMISGGMLSRLDPILLSQALGTISFALTILLFFYLSYRATVEQRIQKNIFLPLTAICLAIHHEFQIYATSGLETAFTTFLVALGFARLTITPPKKYGYLLAGLFLILATMARPDAAIFYAAAIPFILVFTKRGFLNFLWYLLPLILLYLPYWLFRYNYYGHLFPNTFYAKSAHLPYYSQGLIYIWLFVKTYYAVVLFPPALILAVYFIVRTLIKTGKVMFISDKSLVLGILFSVPFIIYIIRIGGDFMFGRLLIPVLPFCFFIVELVFLKLIRGQNLRMLITLLFTAAILLRWHQFTPPEANINGIVDEWAFYPSDKIAKMEGDGLKLNKYLRDLDVTIGFYGARAAMIYYSDLPRAIECDAGLTDQYIAHMPLENRGRPGHEKHAPPQYLQERKVNFILPATMEPGNPYDSLTLISFNGLAAQIWIYDNTVMDKLSVYPEVAFTNFGAYLDQYISSDPNRDSQQYKMNMEFFRQYYFANNDDTERLEKLLQYQVLNSK